MNIKKSFINFILILLSFFFTKCTITQAPKRELTGYDIYPTKKDQLLYDNFMLGRLKHYEYDKDIDLISLAFIDKRFNNNHKLDKEERNIIKKAIEKERLFFCVGKPLYDPLYGDIITKTNKKEGVITQNPLDFFDISDIPRWEGLIGAYLKFEDAKWGLKSLIKNNNLLKDKNLPWGIIEVDFIPLKYGEPIRVLRAWRIDFENKLIQQPIIVYRLKPEVCKLIFPDFKIIYVK